MAVSAAAHICPICGVDECCECRCQFYDWPSTARHYCNSVTGTLKYLALCMKLLSFEL
jgi:hypothetical protein